MSATRGASASIRAELARDGPRVVELDEALLVGRPVDAGETWCGQDRVAEVGARAGGVEHDRCAEALGRVLAQLLDRTHTLGVRRAR